MYMDNFRGFRVKRKTSNGVMGSGIFGMLGTTIQCKDSDNSYYCNFMKLIQIVVYMSIILLIIFWIYSSFKK